MLFRQSARNALLVAASALMTLAPPLDSLARSRPQPVAEEPLPPPPPAGLSDRFLADAAAYQAYVERVSSISPAMASGANVADGVRAAAGYGPRSLTRDAVAYGAVAALGAATFVASVRAAATSPDNRKIIVQYLLSNPNYATSFAGADQAAGLAKAALTASGNRLVESGKLIKAAAYTVQHQAWSKDMVVDQAGRLAAVEAAGSGELMAAPDHVEALRSAAGAAPPLPVTAGAEPAPYGPTVLRALQLAAIAALGEATDDLYDTLRTSMQDGDAEACLRMVRLNLNQCLAVAKPHYEDMFCTGQHAMTDTGACLVKSASYQVAPPPPPPGPPPPVVKPKAKPTSHKRHHRG